MPHPTNNFQLVDWSQAVPILSQGRPLAYPTDTLWGLGCRADDAHAVRACLALKGGQRQPLASMVVRREWLEDLVFIPPEADVDSLLPGPYTLILPMKSKRYAHLAGPKQMLGCRIPDLVELDQLLAGLGTPIISTSLNRHGQSPARGLHDATLQARELDVPLIHADLALPGPSTILRWAGRDWECLRQGVAPRP